MSEITIIDRFLARPAVLDMVGIKSPSTLYQLIKQGDFPPPYSITEGRKGWSLAEIQNWICNRKNRRGA